MEAGKRWRAAAHASSRPAAASASRAAQLLPALQPRAEEGIAAAGAVGAPASSCCCGAGAGAEGCCCGAAAGSTGAGAGALGAGAAAALSSGAGASAAGAGAGTGAAPGSWGWHTADRVARSVHVRARWEAGGHCTIVAYSETAWGGPLRKSASYNSCAQGGRRNSNATQSQPWQLLDHKARHPAVQPARRGAVAPAARLRVQLLRLLGRLAAGACGAAVRCVPLAPALPLAGTQSAASCRGQRGERGMACSVGRAAHGRRRAKSPQTLPSQRQPSPSQQGMHSQARGQCLAQLAKYQLGTAEAGGGVGVVQGCRSTGMSTVARTRKINAVTATDMRRNVARGGVCEVVGVYAVAQAAAAVAAGVASGRSEPHRRVGGGGRGGGRVRCCSCGHRWQQRRDQER